MKLIPRTRGGALLRFSAAALIVVAFTASATAVAGLLQFKQIAHYFDASPAINHAQVTIANPGNPQTLLLIGSDHRAGTPWTTANTDTMMLVHIDPNSSTINLLSVPRDLKVMIPQGHVVAPGKINSAYSIGGPNLLVNILTHQVFPRHSDQPHHRRQLRRLPGARRRHRVRLHRRGSPLLQQHDLHQLLEHRPPAGLREAVRGERPVVRALPPHGHRHRAQRPPAGLPALGEGPVQRGPADRPEEQAARHLRPAHADRPRPPQRRRADQPVRSGRVLRRSRRQAGPVPGDPAAVQPRLHRGERRRHRRDTVLRRRRSRCAPSRRGLVHGREQGALARPPPRAAVRAALPGTARRPGRRSRPPSTAISATARARRRRSATSGCPCTSRA